MSGRAGASAPRVLATRAGDADRWAVPVAVFSPGTTGAQVPVPPSRHQGVVSGRWPLSDSVELGSLPSAVPCARLHVRQLLWEWGLAPLSGDIELLVSELVTNAIAASRSAGSVAIRLWLLADRARVLILVWDASSVPPAPSSNGQDAENGRGLLLVQAMSREWDWYPSAERGGKVVWVLTDRESLDPQ